MDEHELRRVQATADAFAMSRLTDQELEDIRVAIGWERDRRGWEAFPARGPSRPESRKGVARG